MVALEIEFAIIVAVIATMVSAAIGIAAAVVVTAVTITVVDGLTNLVEAWPAFGLLVVEILPSFQK